MSIDLNRTAEEARFYNPLEGFEEDSAEVEYREDPLTGRQTRVVSQWFPRPEERPDAEALVGDGEGCFFCPENVEEATPTYPDFVGFDRGSVGEAVSFPNLFPYGKHANVVALTEDHFRPMESLSADVFADGLACALEYVRAVTDHDDPSFASIDMNFLPSSGSSVVHPHMQAIADDHGTNESRRIRAHEREFYDEHGRTYWEALLDEERSGPRYVGSTGGVEWLAPFAPAHQWHVAGITDAVGMPDPDAGVVADLAEGIANVLDYYADLGLNAFNFALRLAGDEPASPAVLDLVARPAFDERYTNDAFYFPLLHDERIVDVAPEEYAPEVREFF